MDKSWISNNSATQEEYIRGILNFLDFAFANSSENGKILCPCTKCVNCKKRSRMDVYEHLISRVSLEKIKVGGKAGALGDSVSVTRVKSKITVTSDSNFSKR